MKYTGKTFKQTIFAAEITENDASYAELHDTEDLAEVAGEEPSWIAEYRLVSVRRLKRRVRVDVIEVRQ